MNTKLYLIDRLKSKVATDHIVVNLTAKRNGSHKKDLGLVSKKNWWRKKQIREMCCDGCEIDYNE